jgi:hypothetical protein
MTPSRLNRIIFVLGSGVGTCLGQEASPQRVNLGRLSIATVFSTQTEADDPVCDTRKLFDGAGESSCPVAANSVEVRFTSPVVVSQVRVVVAPSAAIAAPSTYPHLKFEISLAASGSREKFNSPVIEVSGARISYNLPRPLTVGQAIIQFRMLRKLADIQEIEILGVPPDGISLAPVTPLIDPARLAYETERPRPMQRVIQESDKPRP